MIAWDKSWKLHHMPIWAKKAIRANAIKKGKWNVYPAYPITNYAEAHFPAGLLDHWGTINRNGVLVLITQPYGNHDDLAAKFAEELRWSVKSFAPGPWNEGTWYYEFFPLESTLHFKPNKLTVNKFINIVLFDRAIQDGYKLNLITGKFYKA